MFRHFAATALALTTGLAAPAAAQTAVSCGAKAPAAGALVRGPVLQVIDARTLCVALGPLPQEWLRLKLRPANGPHGGAQALFAQTVSCRVAAHEAGAPLAACDVVESNGATRF
ncbi:hypothetical protein [Phenylobacterium montanum]|uniref:Uncharacterized protein n=1 Tax=Phenylobacterium montanum TaxID=2823693 RepID=A0A975FYN2_9CAUL|nr:hypothetical protein [Caulobacter sp. S6]QUD86726.1 hypothetical protein KCG34_16800 [Caulobacter sp. S6]